MSRTRSFRILLLLLLSVSVLACGGGESRSPDPAVPGDSMAAAGAPAPKQELAMANFAGDAPLQYDDGTLAVRYPRVPTSRQRLGVWFTPTAVRPCTLRTVQFMVAPADSSRIAMGFIYRAVRAGGPMKLIEGPIDSFEVAIPGRQSMVAVDRTSRMMTASDQWDLFIALEFPGRGSDLSLLGDSVASHTPPRSYALAGGSPHSAIAAVAGDLGVRASFDCRSPAPSGGIDTIRLQWDKRPADLDLYLIRTPGEGTPSDTIYWGRKTLDSARRLDVDVIRDFGPETIIYRRSAGEAESLRVAVYYHAPAQGPPTRAVVSIQSNGTVRRDTCVLKPSVWWNVSSRFGSGGWFGSACDTLTDAARSARRKTVTGR